MGKSKAQRKQEKKTSMQEVKKEQELKNKEKIQKELQAGIEKSEAANKTQAKKTDNIKHVGPEQVTLTMYTLIAMIVTFITAAVTAVAMFVYAKPIIHLLKVTVGETLNEYSYEAVEQVIMENYPSFAVYEMYLGVAALVALGAVLMVVCLIKAVNEYNKPNIIVGIVSVLFAVGALVLFIYADNETRAKIAELEIPERPEFGIYSVYLPLLITNIVALICNVFSSLAGLKRWKKTGRTSK